MSGPRAVLISDIHFTVATLDLATSSLIQAINHAYKLGIPLYICGDTLDNKAIMRAEVVNRLLDIAKNSLDVPITILVGNHDLINEKGYSHSLEFLKPYWTVVDDLHTLGKRDSIYAMPYIGDKEKFKEVFDKIPKGATVIMHQGVQSAYMGHYMQDNSSLPKEYFQNHRVISGHYHKSQDIDCGNGGVFSYVGNPYTLSFSEAVDGLKGYKVLNWDGSLTHHCTNLRKHVIIETDVDNLAHVFNNLHKDDLLLLKIRGPRSKLVSLNKEEIGSQLLGHSNFRLDLIPLESERLQETSSFKELTEAEVMDSIIDVLEEDISFKDTLKSTWRKLINHENT